MDNSVWYQVIGSMILPIDVIHETPKTLIVKTGGKLSRVIKGKAYASTMEDANRQAIRNTEDDIARYEMNIEHNRIELEKAYLNLARLKDYDQT